MTGSRRNALVGTTTSIGNVGARPNDNTAPRIAATTATITACSASPPSTDRVDTPTALNTAKSRTRSSADR